MARATLANNATSTLNGAITNVATSIVLVDGSKFPSSGYFWVTLLDSTGVVEIALCTARAGNTLTVTRGQDGTTGVAFATASKCSLNITKAVLNELAPLTGELTSGTWPISVSGNAATVTNGVVTTGSYGDPAWLTALAGAKVTGTVPAATNATNLIGSGSISATTTATTAAAADNDTSVATTAFVQQELTSQAVKLTGAQSVAGVKTFSSPATFGSASMPTPSGNAPLYDCRAWCVFDGTLTGTNAPIAGGNVTSITRTTTGEYTVNFATAMPTANYSSVVSCAPGATGTNGYATLNYAVAPTASALAVIGINGANTRIDANRFSVSVFC